MHPLILFACHPLQDCSVSAVLRVAQNNHGDVINVCHITWKSGGNLKSNPRGLDSTGFHWIRVWGILKIDSHKHLHPYRSHFSPSSRPRGSRRSQGRTWHSVPCQSSGLWRASVWRQRRKRREVRGPSERPWGWRSSRGGRSSEGRPSQTLLSIHPEKKTTFHLKFDKQSIIWLCFWQQYLIASLITQNVAVVVVVVGFAQPGLEQTCIYEFEHKKLPRERQEKIFLWWGRFFILTQINSIHRNN